MTAHLNITDVIDAHRAAVLVDEASFDGSGRAIDSALAGKTGVVERAAFIEFVSAPCRSCEDVQAKVAYILAGTVGDRDALLDCLIEYGDDLGERFVRSLLVNPPNATLAKTA